MLGHAFAAAAKAKQIHEEEKSRRRCDTPKSRRTLKQGWFKPGTGGQQLPTKESKKDVDSVVSNHSKKTVASGRTLATETDFDGSQSSSVAPSLHDSNSTSTSTSGITYSHISVASDLLESMENEKLADVILVGRDSCEVRAIRFVLACRTNELREVLYNHIGPDSRVFIGDYSQQTIRTVKSFCHTGELSTELCEKSADTVRCLVELADFANTYNFEALHAQSIHRLAPILQSSPWFVTAAFDAASSKAAITIENYAIKLLEDWDHDLLLETNACRYISQSRLRRFLQLLRLPDQWKVQVLQKWLGLHQAEVENQEALVNQCGRDLSLKNLEISAVHTLINLGYSPDWVETETETETEKDGDNGLQPISPKSLGLSSLSSHSSVDLPAPAPSTRSSNSSSSNNSRTQKIRKRNKPNNKEVDPSCVQLTPTGGIVTCLVRSDLSDLVLKKTKDDNRQG